MSAQFCKEHNTDNVWFDYGWIRGHSPRIYPVWLWVRLASVYTISEQALEVLCDINIDSQTAQNAGNIFNYNMFHGSLFIVEPRDYKKIIMSTWRNVPDFGVSFSILLLEDEGSLTVLVLIAAWVSATDQYNFVGICNDCVYHTNNTQLQLHWIFAIMVKIVKVWHFFNSWWQSRKLSSSEQTVRK